MKFAFNISACPNWDLETAISKAKTLGYDGVELRADLPHLSGRDPQAVQSLFASANLQIACLSTSISTAGNRKTDDQAASQLQKHVDAAHAMGCPFVRILTTRIQGGQSLTESAAALARWLLPLVEYATDQRVALAIENAFPFRRASELWMVLEAINHPRLFVAWDLLAATQAAEPPSISIPVLNSRLQIVGVTDAQVDQTPITRCKLGEGNLPVRKLLTRLQGIGYSGWVSFDWPKSRHPQLADPDEVLPDAIAKLRDWTKPPAKPEKAKPAPKPAVAAGQGATT